jgi:hypothetical protein
MQFPTAGVEVVAAQAFGREEAMFQGLLSFMASVSLTLWAMVLLTAIARFVACHVLYRRRQLPSLLTSPTPTVLAAETETVLAGDTPPVLASRADKVSAQYVA